MTGEFSRTLSDGPAGFPAMLAAIEQHLEEREVPPGPSAQLMIAFDEIISNILAHGGDSRPPIIEVALAVTDGRAQAEVADDGRAFDPLAAPPPDTSLSVEDRPIGGLGIHLVRELMEDVSYLRENDCNRLRFSKTLPLD